MTSSSWPGVLVAAVHALCASALGCASLIEPSVAGGSDTSSDSTGPEPSSTGPDELDCPGRSWDETTHACGMVGSLRLCYRKVELMHDTSFRDKYVTDLNSDGSDDLVVIGLEPDAVHTFLSDSRCGLGTVRTTPLVRWVSYSQMFDADEDGHVDILVNHRLPSGEAWITTLLFGDEDGYFFRQALIPTMLGGTLEAAGDLDLDGHTDVVASFGEEIHIYTGDGRGGFTAQPPLSLAGDLFYARIADLDEDGIPDILTHQELMLDDFTYVDQGVLLLGTLKGYETTYYDVGWWPTGAAVADLDIDGHLDFAVTGFIYMGKGGGLFTRSDELPGLEFGINPVDIDGDGLLDLVTGADILINRGDRFVGGFEGFYVPVSGLTGDFNGDGRPDLVGHVPPEGPERQDHLGVYLSIPPE